jgi:hypothetical protein
MLDTLPGDRHRRAVIGHASRGPVASMTVVKYESMFSRRMSPEILPLITLIE